MNLTLIDAFGMFGAKPGSKIVVTIYRSNTEQKIELILGHRWDETGRIMARRR